MDAAIEILNAPKIEPWNDLFNSLSGRSTSLLILAVFLPLWITFPIIHGPLMLWLWYEPITLSMETKRALNSGDLSGIEVPAWVNSCLSSSDQISQETAQAYIDKALGELRPMLAWQLMFFISCIIGLFLFYATIIVGCMSKCASDRE